MTTPLGKNGRKYHPAVFSLTKQIPGLSGGLNRFCKNPLFTHSSSVSQTDGRTDEWKSDLQWPI